jgi:hypothetical protein
MPILRNFTLKIKTKFTPLSSPTTASSPPPQSSSSFEAVGRQERQRERAQANESMESIASQESGSTGGTSHAKVMMESLGEVKQERTQKRRSKFREEF